METTLTLDDVYHAIRVLYHDSDISGKKNANSWLGEFQKSVFAWKMSDELLQQNRDVASSYFAAQTMRTKIQFSFHELPPESHHSLRDSLINHICTASDNNSAVLTQLCLALADLALQMVSWKMSTRELIQQLSKNVKLIPALLETLSLLPDELHNRSLRLSANRKEEVIYEFTNVGPTLFELLGACTEAFGATDAIFTKILKCLGIWLGFGAIPSAEIARSDLLVRVFRSLGDCDASPTVHKAASDCICEALVLVEELDLHAELKQALLQGVRTLIEPYNRSVKTGDKSLNYCRIFTELAESLLEEIVKTGSLHTMEMVLVCAESGDREAAEVTFHVWHRLSEFLWKMGKNKNAQLIEPFKPFISRLIAALCRLCRLQPGFVGIIDDEDDFAEFRAKVSELIKDVVFVVGSFECLRQIFVGNSTWEASEVSLFVMCAVVHDVREDPDGIIPEVLEAILNFPDDTHVAMRFTCVRLVGKLREWVNNNPRSIEPVLNFLLRCLHDSLLATAAATSLQSIANTCTEHMGPHFDGFLHIIRNVRSFNISQEAAVGLFEGTVTILAEMPSETISKGVRQLCSIHASELHQESSKVSPIKPLQRLTAIFRNLKLNSDNAEPHPCADVVREIWPILSETLVRFQPDHSIIEECCKCIRVMIRCVGQQCSPILQPVVKLIVQLYRTHPHSCYLYLAGALVDECGVDPHFHLGLIEMMEALCGPALMLLENGVENHPDTVEDLFRMCSKYEKRLMVPFLQSSMSGAIIRCGLLACSIAHREANVSVLRFFGGIAYSHCDRKWTEEESKVCRELVGACLTEHGAVLIKNLIVGYIADQQVFMIENLAELIFELMYFDRRAVCSWLKKAVEGLPRKSAVSQEKLADFIRAVDVAKKCADVKKSVKKLSRLYR